MTINWVCQVATEPRLIGVGVDSGAVTHRLIESGGGFSINFLDRENRALVRKFVKPVGAVELDDTGRGEMNGVPVFSTPSGFPVLSAALSHLECEVFDQMDLGSHTWFVGAITGHGAADPEYGVDPPTLLRMEDTRMSYGG